MPIVSQAMVDELEELRARKSEFGRRDNTQVSKSGRTTVAVEMTEDGRAVITVDRDGRRVHRIDVEKEPIDKVGS